MHDNGKLVSLADSFRVWHARLFLYTPRPPSSATSSPPSQIPISKLSPCRRVSSLVTCFSRHSIALGHQDLCVFALIAAPRRGWFQPRVYNTNFIRQISKDSSFLEFLRDILDLKFWAVSVRADSILLLIRTSVLWYLCWRSGAKAIDIFESFGIEA